MMRGTYQVEFNTQEREREKREALEERPALLKKIERLEKELEKSRLITCTDTPAMTAEEQWEMRVYLALSHQDGKCLIYGDDGELQCKFSKLDFPTNFPFNRNTQCLRR